MSNSRKNNFNGQSICHQLLTSFFFIGESKGRYFGRNLEDLGKLVLKKEELSLNLTVISCKCEEVMF
jgi:hypothetical protein